MINVLNVNRWFVLGVYKATDARHSKAAKEWDEYAMCPEAAWSVMSGLLFIGGCTAQGLSIGSLILADMLSGGHLPMYFIYLFGSLPLICAMSGSVECKVGETGAERLADRGGRMLYDDPQFNVHIVNNNRLLLRSSLLGLLIALIVPFALSVFLPLHR